MQLRPDSANVVNAIGSSGLATKDRMRQGAELPLLLACMPIARFLRDIPTVLWQDTCVGTLARDTHRLVHMLAQRGFSEEQAEAVVELISEIDTEHLATKADIQLEVRGLEIRLLKWAVPTLLGQVAVFAAVVRWLLG